MNHKALRMQRLFDPLSKRALFLPIDHGTTLGPLSGLTDIPNLVKQMNESGYQTVIAHKGIIQMLAENPEVYGMDYMLHLSASTTMGPDSSFKQQVTSVEHALRLGVSGISVHTNLGVLHEPEMIKELGEICDQAYNWGLPLLVMMNVVKDGNTTNIHSHGKKIAHAIRLAGELGADMVKVECPTNLDMLPEVINAFPIPVLIAGGIKTDSKLKWFQSLESCLEAGAKGLCIGRNVFEDENPLAMGQALNALVHDRQSATEAYGLYTDSRQALPLLK